MRAVSVEVRDLLETRRQWALVVVGLVLLALVPFVTDAFTTLIAFKGLVFVMLGVSWNLVAGYAGQISLGHSAFFGLGGFVSVWLVVPERVGLPGAIQSPVLVALVAGGVAAGLLALVFGPVFFRLTGHYFAVGTLAFAAIVELVLLDRRGLSGGQSGLFVLTGMDREVLYLVGLVATVGMILVTHWIVEGSLGLGMRAIHGDEAAANSLGVDPLKYKMYSFVISSFMAGVAGALWVQFNSFASPESTAGIQWMIDTLVIAVLGGMGTIVGPVVGGALFLGLDTGISELVADEYVMVIEGTLIVVIMIFAPEGIYGLVPDRLLGSSEADSPTDGTEDLPADDAEDLPADDAENLPADDAENPPADDPDR